MNTIRIKGRPVRFSDVVLKANKQMKVVDDMAGTTSKYCLLTFDNGYTASIITGYATNGSDYEVAVLDKEFKIDYGTSFGDIVRCDGEDALVKILKDIQGLPTQ